MTKSFVHTLVVKQLFNVLILKPKKFNALIVKMMFVSNVKYLGMKVYHAKKHRIKYIQGGQKTSELISAQNAILL
jgi:hypothetical protein